MNNTSDLPSQVHKNLDSGMNCCEAILSAFLESENLSSDLSRIATPFGGGIGGKRDLCGLLTGGLMVIGLTNGRTDKSDKTTKDKCYKTAAQYYDWFEKNFSVQCKDILKGSFAGHTEKCLDLSKKSAAKIMELIHS